MKKSIFIAAAAALGFSCAANAQGLSTITENGRKVVVTAITDNIIRVSNNPAQLIASGKPKTVEVGTPSAQPVYFKTAIGKGMTTASGIVATLSDATGAVTIAADGRTITDSGLRPLADGRQSISLSTPGNESFYGAGERGFTLNLAGDTLVMFNRQNYGYTAGDPRIRQMNITMPILISSLGYAIVFDDFGAAELIAGHPLKYVTETGSPVDYYFINGVNGKTSQARLDNVVRQLSSITGRQDLPPLWSLGYITSKYGYRTEAETKGAVDTLKRAGYPLDGIVLDLYWYGKEEDMGRLDWDPAQWPSYKKMLKQLKDRGVNLVAISQPYVLRNGKGVDNYNYLADNGMLAYGPEGEPGEVAIWVGEGGMLDVSNPATRKWLADRYKTLTDGGITGWWGDLGEPEVHPDSLVHYNGLTAREYHNRYGNDWSQIIFDLFREQYPDTRLMTMMRGGTTGLQRYSVFPWSTDVSRSWGGLQPQITIMLNSGLSGLGYMSHDVGGFAIDPENPIDPELYVRWLQLGLFSPILRTHAQKFAEPYHYPEYEHIILPIVKERYAWLPYNYTLAYENASQGLPLVRPLNFYDNPADTPLDLEDEFLWGRDVLVAPVITPGTTERAVVFPSGKWLDPADPSVVYNGGDTVVVPAPLDVLPLFVRAGSFIPRADYRMENTRDYRTNDYTVDFYPVAGKSDGFIYEDDLTTPGNVAAGRYDLLRFNADTTPDRITVALSVEKGAPDYKPVPANRTLILVVHNVDRAPESMKASTGTAKFTYDAAARTVRALLRFPVSNPPTVTIVK